MEPVSFHVAMMPALGPHGLEIRHNSIIDFKTQIHRTTFMRKALGELILIMHSSLKRATHSELTTSCQCGQTQIQI